MALVALNGSTFTTGHPCTPVDSLINTTVTTVIVQGTPVLLSGATIAGAHPFGPAGKNPCGAFHSVVYSGGSATVRANGIPIGRIGDPVDLGAISSGATTVFCS